MARTFFPFRGLSISIPAPSHARNAEYKISVGQEDWGAGVFRTVVKVQMAYGKRVSGRRSPSYPLDSNDYKKVCSAIEKLVKDYNKKSAKK